MKPRRGFFEGALIAGMLAGSPVHADTGPRQKSPEATRDVKESLADRQVVLNAEYGVVAEMHPRGNFKEIKEGLVSLKDIGIEGINNETGEPCEILIHKDVVPKLLRMKEYFETHAPEELKTKVGFRLTYGFRSYEDQARVKAESDRRHPEVVAKGKSYASPPGASVHHTGYFFDMYMGPHDPELMQKMCIFWYGTPEQWKDPNFIAPVVRLGGLPTEEKKGGEPWHLGGAPENKGEFTYGDTTLTTYTNEAAVKFFRANRNRPASDERRLIHPYEHYKGPILDKAYAAPTNSIEVASN